MLEMRTSERRDLKQCTQKWFWSTVEGLAPKRSANPLWFGSAVHEGLAAWYQEGLKRGPHPAETFDNFLTGNRSVLVTSEDEEKEYVDARAMGIDMLTRYVEHYGKDESWHVIATEKTFRVLIKRPEIEIFGVKQPAQERWLRYVGTWDGVFIDLTTGEVWLMEHKTAASIRVDHLPLDDQAGSYWAVATRILRKMGILKPGQQIAGIRYNFLRKAVTDERPRNEDGFYTNLPQKQHYVDALYNHFGQDSPGEEMEEWEADLPKMSLKELKELAEVQEVQVFGDVSKSQPPPYFERFDVYRSKAEQATMIKRIQEEAIFSEAYREGWLPVTKSPTMLGCSMCPFKRMCELHESGDMLAVEEFKETQFIVRNPYADHVKKSAE